MIWELKCGRYEWKTMNDILFFLFLEPRQTMTVWELHTWREGRHRMPDACSLTRWAPPHQRASRPQFASQVLTCHSFYHHHPAKRPTTVHVLVSLKCFFAKLHNLSKLFAHITAICVQGSLKQARVWKAMEKVQEVLKFISLGKQWFREKLLFSVLPNWKALKAIEQLLLA